MQTSTPESKHLGLRYLELKSLFELNKTLNATLNLEIILNHVLLTPMGRMMMSRGAVLLRQGSDRHFVIRAAKGVPAAFVGRMLELDFPCERSVTLKEHQGLPSGGASVLYEAGFRWLFPLCTGQTRLGFLAFGGKFGAPDLSDEERDYLHSIAHIAAMAIHNSLTFQELREANKKLDKRVQELNTLFEISRELNSCLDISKIAHLLAYAVMGEFLIHRCVVALRFPGEELRLVVAKGVQGAGDQLEGWRLADGAWVEGFTSPVLVRQLMGREKAFAGWLEGGIQYGIPMRSPKGLRGILGVGAKVTGEELSEEELAFLSTIANEASIAIENTLLIEEMLEKQRMEEELAIAQEIQRKLLPEECPKLETFQIAGTNVPSREVGGDYFDCFFIHEDALGIAIADVSGKGAPAALLMANLQASLRALASVDSDLKSLMSRINRLICQNTSPDKFITFFFGRLDPTHRCLRYCNAGHNPPMLFRGDGEVEFLERGGLLLGLFPDAPYEDGSVELEPGDVLVLYTDGITEALNAREEEFGEERLVEVVRSVGHRSSSEIVQAIQQAVEDFTGGTPQADDFTLVVVKAR